MSIEVFGAGFGRTATRSLKQALEIQGYDACHHTVEVFEHPEHLLVFEASQGREPLCGFLGKPVPAPPQPEHHRGVRRSGTCRRCRSTGLTQEQMSGHRP